MRYALRRTHSHPSKHCTEFLAIRVQASIQSSPSSSHTVPSPLTTCPLLPRLRNLLIRIRARGSLRLPLRLPAPLTLTMVMLALIMLMRVLRLPPALIALAWARRAIIRLAIRVIVARTIAGGLVAGLAGFAGRVVYAAHCPMSVLYSPWVNNGAGAGAVEVRYRGCTFAALLPHALVVYYIFCPLDVSSLLRLGAQAQDT